MRCTGRIDLVLARVSRYVQRLPVDYSSRHEVGL